ncbi:MAG: GNAT family N-acetyltransferase [Nocardioidaceae bacterium]
MTGQRETVGVVTLEPMTTSEYRRWLEPTIVEYAQDKVASGEWAQDGSVARSRRAFRDLLPNGAATPDHRLFTARADGEEIGTLWLYVSAEHADAFIYDIAVHEPQRGRGLGRALLGAAETWSRERGMRSVSLHVFGHNAVARRLYVSAGYEVTDLSMRKLLG